jgi:hypothetical protein
MSKFSKVIIAISFAVCLPCFSQSSLPKCFSEARVAAEEACLEDHPSAELVSLDLLHTKSLVEYRVIFNESEDSTVILNYDVKLSQSCSVISVQQSVREGRTVTDSNGYRYRCDNGQDGFYHCGQCTHCK